MGAAKKVRATKLHIYRKVDGDKLMVGITDRPDDGDMYLLGYLSASRQPCSRCLMQTNALARRNKVHRVMDWPYEVNGASLDESLHNRGLGAWMYAELARMAWASRRAPIAMSECCRGYTTSLAKRAWASKSLAKSVDVEGDVVGLWRDRTKTGLATPPPAPPGFVLLDAVKPQRPARAARQRNPAKTARETPYRLPAFMRSGSAAWARVKKSDEIRMPTQRETYDAAEQEYKDRAEVYTARAKAIARAGTVIVYRVIAIPTKSAWRESVNLQCIGKAWSAERRCAGVYGYPPHKRGTTREIMLVGLVEARHVDWFDGLVSFIVYGEAQWEISLLPHAPVLLREVDGETLHAPILGSTGTAGEMWSRSCV